VQFEFGSELNGLTETGQTIQTALTSSGKINVGALVNAAGPWAGTVAKLAGLNLPVTPVPRHVAVTQPADGLTDDLPMTVWANDGFHLRVRDGRPLLIWTTKDQPLATFEITKDREWLDAIYARALQSFPCLQNAPLDEESSWVGLYEMSPDKTAIVGLAPGFSNFYLANGSSGHGVMHSPAIGRLLSEVILDGKASIDISALSPARFTGSIEPINDVL